jgi:hypothetical protein
MRPLPSLLLFDLARIAIIEKDGSPLPSYYMPGVITVLR